MGKLSLKAYPLPYKGFARSSAVGRKFPTDFADKPQHVAFVSNYPCRNGIGGVGSVMRNRARIRQRVNQRNPQLPNGRIIRFGKLGGASGQREEWEG